MIVLVASSADCFSDSQSLRDWRKRYGPDWYVFCYCPRCARSLQLPDTGKCLIVTLEEIEGSEVNRFWDQTAEERRRDAAIGRQRKGDARLAEERRRARRVLRDAEKHQKRARAAHEWCMKNLFS